MKGILGWIATVWERAVCCHVEVQWSPLAPQALRTVVVVVQDQRGSFQSRYCDFSWTPWTLHYIVSGWNVFGEKAKKKNLELRVYSVKSGLIGHTSYVHSIIVHFSSGGEISPQSVVPKHSASRSQWAHIFHRAEAWGALQTMNWTIIA